MRLQKILIANRGEIACRVMRTARRVGVECVAVFSDADAKAQHVKLAEQSVRLGGAASVDSYLRADRVIEAALATGAQAIHPGYGFLSENAEFADKVLAAGLTFIGPPGAAMRAMGSKDSAKTRMEAAGVPLLPGYHGEDQSPARLQAEAEACGLGEGKPVLLKAVLGGGGKGMRIVNAACELEAAVASAQREAVASFGDGRLLIERYLPRARHLEVQVFCDTHGGAVHLFERDCSVQRRHQKVLEEAPGPGVTSELRTRLGEAAVKAAQAVGYEGAGTVEFIADADEPSHFYFMEMNTRLQVEHPVTELVSGVDLVEWQLRVAGGEKLPLAQPELDRALAGHAIEARIYAERPAAGFLPGSGRIAHLRLPQAEGDSYAPASVRAGAAGAVVRVDSGVEEGDEVSVHYDPMLAKLIVRDADREAACRRLHAALGQWQTVGVPTNVEFLRRVLHTDAFVAGEVHTAFIEQHRPALFPPPMPPPRAHLLVAAVQWMQHRVEALTQELPAHSPFAAIAFGTGAGGVAERVCGGGGSEVSPLKLQLLDDDGNADGEPMRLQLWRKPAQQAPDTATPVSAWGWRHAATDSGGVVKLMEWEPASRGFRAEVDGVSLRGHAVVQQGAGAAGSTRLSVFSSMGLTEVEVRDVAQQAAEAALSAMMSGSAASQRPVAAPMPGKLVKILVEKGQKVLAGDALVVLEAMKMEHTLTAAAEAVVEAVHAKEGELVGQKALLVSFANA